MKELTIPASEASRFWNIFTKVFKNKNTNVAFHNHFAIFTVESRFGLLSYSTKYEGPEHDGCFCFYCLYRGYIEEIKNDIIFRIREYPTEEFSYYSYGDQHTESLYSSSPITFPDIQDDGAELPADTPKLIRRMLKIKRGASRSQDNNIHFIAGSDYERIAFKCGRSTVYIKTPLIKPEARYTNADINVTKLLPGGGVVSILNDEDSTKLCYQVGGWLYICNTSGLPIQFPFLPAPSPGLPKITFDRTDIKAMLAPCAGWGVRKWQYYDPWCIIRTSSNKITASFRHDYSDPLPDVVLNKTKWAQNGFVPEFCMRLRDLRNAFSAGFKEFSVDMMMITSYAKGMYFTYNVRQ